ncbi:MAG: hypothetical protein IIC60_12125 [Proteobacteria bacterium]|nr:hypothetical protein [Pseudomonadota bacterium]
MKFYSTLATMALMMAIACSPVCAQQLDREFIDSAGGFTQVVTVSDHGVKTIYVSGQATISPPMSRALFRDNLQGTLTTSQLQEPSDLDLIWR